MKRKDDTAVFFEDIFLGGCTGAYGDFVGITPGCGREEEYTIRDDEVVKELRSLADYHEVETERLRGLAYIISYHGAPRARKAMNMRTDPGRADELDRRIVKAFGYTIPATEETGTV